MGAWAYINKMRGEKERQGGRVVRRRTKRASWEEKEWVEEGEKLKRKEWVKTALNKGDEGWWWGVKDRSARKRKKKLPIWVKDCGGRDEEREGKRKKFNLLKILQIAPVHNSSKLPTNQDRVPITLPLHGDQITLRICVQGGKEKKGSATNEESRNSSHANGKHTVTQS